MKTVFALLAAIALTGCSAEPASKGNAATSPEVQAVKQWMIANEGGADGIVLITSQKPTAQEHSQAQEETGNKIGNYTYVFVKQSVKVQNNKATVKTDRVYVLAGGKVLDSFDFGQVLGWRGTSLTYKTRMKWEDCLTMAEEIYLIGKRQGWIYAGGHAELK